jgi:hypothetical protein
MEVNSKGYWDNRFDTDWVSNLGRHQSAFFSNIGLGGFPEWLSLEIEDKQLSICDWGCALGDGTNVLKNRFPQSAITGIDFSSVAIADAKETYPGIQFLSENLLEKDHAAQYDVIFSSNTLEHFSNPWTTLQRVSNCANRHLVVLVPYKEKNRYSEHLYTFSEGNIPSQVGSSFFLTHVEIIHGGSFTPSYWGDLQVLLVYSHTTAIAENGLKIISDSEIRIIEGLREQKEVLKEIQEVKAGLVEQSKLLEQNKWLEQTLELERTRLQELTKELDQTRLLVTRYEQDLEQYKGAIAEKETAIQNLKLQHEKEFTQTLQTLRKENEQLSAEVSRAEDKLKVRNGIHTLLEEQLEEKNQVLAGLQLSLDKEATTAQQLQQANNELQALVRKLEGDLNWYSATYEQRSVLGVLKDKTIKSRTKK